MSSNLRHIRVFEMDVEDEEDEERADESQDISSDQDGLEEPSTKQGAAGAEGEAEACEEMGEGSGDTLEQTSESDTLWVKAYFTPTLNLQHTNTLLSGDQLTSNKISHCYCAFLKEECFI